MNNQQQSIKQREQHYAQNLILVTLILVNFLVFFYLTSCSNINFLVEKKEVSGFLQNKTNVYSDGWEKHYLKDALFMQLGEPFERRFLLTPKVTEKQTKRSIGDNQVAEKIDFRVVVDYTLIDSSNNCPEIKNRQISCDKNFLKSC